MIIISSVLANQYIIIIMSRVRELFQADEHAVGRLSLHKLLEHSSLTVNAI